MKRLADHLKVDLKLKSMQVLNKKAIESWLPIRGKFRRYIMRNGEYVSKKSSAKQMCKALVQSSCLHGMGKFFRVCFDKNADYVMGGPHSGIIQGDLGRIEIQNIQEKASFREGI